MHRTPFPTAADLPALSPDDAARALAELARLVAADLADVYTQPYREHPSDPYRWNVWLGHQLVPGGERIELPAWAARYLEGAAA